MKPVAAFRAELEASTRFGKEIQTLTRCRDGIPVPPLAPGDRCVGVERTRQDRDVVGPASELESRLGGPSHLLVVAEAPCKPRLVEHQPGPGDEVVVGHEVAASRQHRLELVPWERPRQSAHPRYHLDDACVRACGLARRSDLLADRSRFAQQAKGVGTLPPVKGELRGEPQGVGAILGLACEAGRLLEELLRACRGAAPRRDRAGLEARQAGRLGVLGRRRQLRGLNAVVGHQLGELGIALACASEDALRRPIVKQCAVGTGERRIGHVPDEVMAEPEPPGADRQPLLHERLLSQGGQRPA